MNLGLYILKFVYLKEPQLIDEIIFGIGIFSLGWSLDIGNEYIPPQLPHSTAGFTPPVSECRGHID